MDKYRLVIFGNDWDVYQVAYREMIDDPNFVYIPSFRPKGLLGQLQRMQFNPKLNSLLSIPGKSLWNPYYLHGVKEQQLCFFLQESWLKMEYGIRLLPYLREHYPQAKIVCFVQDLIATIKDHYSHRPIDIGYIKQYADLIVSYDQNDAGKYGIDYHPTIYSPIERASSEPAERYDLFFLGRDKGRLPLLINICNEARQRGLVCKFLLIEVPKARQAVCEGITYLSQPLTYKENLCFCSESRCIIELLQPDAVSPTFRTWEAISLNKKLLTNGAFITKSEVYDTRYISVFHDETDVDWIFIERDNPFPDGKNPYQELIRPESLIRFIENKLSIQIQRA